MTWKKFSEEVVSCILLALSNKISCKNLCMSGLWTLSVTIRADIFSYHQHFHSYAPHLATPGKLQAITWLTLTEEMWQSSISELPSISWALFTLQGSCCNVSIKDSRAPHPGRPPGGADFHPMLNPRGWAKTRLLFKPFSLGVVSTCRNSLAILTAKLKTKQTSKQQ